MTREFQQMMRLAASGAAGKELPLHDPVTEWDRLIALARQQRVQCLLANALKMPAGQACPEDKRAALLREYRAAAISNVMRRGALLQLLGEMEAAGIPAVLIKGYAVADCYAVPESRMSADADVWVDPKDEERACDFLKRQGFTIQPRWEKGHHAVCHHPRIGCVELHVILYDEIVEDVWFGKMDGKEFVQEPYQTIRSEDGSFRTLGYTDHFIFLVLHMVKHFIISGFTLQMMLDVALYLKQHAGLIDTERFWKTVGGLHYDRLVHSVLWAMIKYCGFEQSDFPGVASAAPEQVDMILNDLEQGGWMGSNNKQDREEGWYEYNRQKLVRRNGRASYFVYMLRWKLGQYKAALFPERASLAARYPYVKKYPFLLPAAWLHRLIFRGFKAIRKGALTSYVVVDEEKLAETGKERLRLFQELDML